MKIKLRKAILWFFWDFLGFHLVWRKILPQKSTNAPSSFIIWIVGIYFALYGIAIQRYENRVNTIENRVSLIISQLGTNKYKEVLEKIPAAQNMGCPLQPSLNNPLSVILSFVCKSIPHADTVESLKDIIVSYKDDLSKVNLSNIVSIRS